MTPFTKRMPKIAGAVWSLALMAALGWLLDSNALQAQRWEYMYGSTTRLEDGKFRVIPVTGNCSTLDEACITTYANGYIAVGTSIPGAGDPQLDDVHVVRTDNNGARVWEYTYDITGANDVDQGWSIIECANGTGFVITGQTMLANGDVEAFLLKIDCAGRVLWSFTYGGGPLADGGRDLIEATTGNAMMGTAAGDIVVCGYTDVPGGTQDGYIFRTTAGGALIWGSAYNYPTAIAPLGQQELFYSLEEATPLGGVLTGDIIAVGYTQFGGVQDAIVTRVNGDNGWIGGAPQGLGVYGVATVPGDVFYSVIELQNPAEVQPNGQPNVVLCGTYASGPPSIYLVKLAGGDPCLPLVQQTYNGALGEHMEGRTIREINFAVPGAVPAYPVVQWDLVLTGFIMQPIGFTDAILLNVIPGNLTHPAGGLAQAYGGQGGNEEGWSDYPVAAVGGRTFGFVFCGHTTQNWYWPPIPGPIQEMYLVKTDGYGATGCERNLAVAGPAVVGFICPPMNRVNVLNWLPRNTSKICQYWARNICPRPPGVPCTVPEDELLPGGLSSTASRAGSGTPGILGVPAQVGSSEGSDGGVNITTLPQNKLSPGGTLSATVYPNPVKTGDPMWIVSPSAGEAAVTVTNTVGETILSNTKLMPNEKGEVVLKTSGWAAGVYLVTVENGGVQSTIRVVVVE